MPKLPPRTRNTLISLAAILFFALFVSPEQQSQQAPAPKETRTAQPTTAPQFSDALSGQMVRVEGWITRELKDDNKGSRHQRFLMRTADGTSILVAHNIDLAPRVADLTPGEAVRLYGEYEWNDKGGVLHWTHHAPRGDHADGWIDYQGKRYQ